MEPLVRRALRAGLRLRVVFASVLLAVLWPHAGHAQSVRNYFSESAYRHYGNEVPPASTVEGMCASIAVPWGWTTNGYSYTVEQELPGRWRCQRYYNGVREPSWYIWVLGQCQVNAAPPRSGAYWSSPQWDENVGDCYCTAPANFDASIQWCDAASAYLPATPVVCRDESCTVGNPVQPGSGTKIHSEPDYASAGAHPVTLTRLYRSDSVAASSLANVEVGWMHSYGSRLVLNPYGNGNPVVAVRPDASLRRFTSASAGVPRAWQGDSGTRDLLTEVRDAAGALTGWRYAVVADDSLETYDATGGLLSIQARNGWMTTLTYSDANTPFDVAPRAGLLISVKNHFGRELRFVYNAQARIAEVLPPGAIAGSAPGNATSPIRYSYDEPASLSGVPPQGQLTSVTWQDGTTRRYHYEDNRHPHALTGITDEAGTRYATYAYDSNRRVVSQQHAGGTDRIDFSYASNQTVVTSYSPGTATQHTYSFTNQGGVLRPTAVSAPCPQCGTTAQSSNYDSAGDVTKTVAHDGMPTFYKYDAKHREIERATYAAGYASATTRPALNLAESVVSTKWHGTWNLPTQVAEPGKISVYTYNARGMTGQSWTATTDATGAAKFNAVKAGSTYATGWGYNANGLNNSVVERTDATETGRWTMAYNALGDLTRIIDVTGGNRIGRVTQYDAQGRVLMATTIAGDAISLAYTPRGFVGSRTEAGKINTYVQNAIGLTTEVRLPGGQVAGFEYSADHRLTAVRLNGALLAGATIRNGVPGNPILARTAELLERLLSATLRPAHAQAAAAGGMSFGSSVTPAMGLPGQPGVNASAILMGEDRPGNTSPGGLLPRFNPATRRLAEVLTAFCKCDPSGGYDRPKLTPLSYLHIVISGHTAPVYVNKSYFSGQPINQALVDEVMSKLTREPVRQGSELVYYAADMGREVGFKRGLSGTFEPTRDITLRVHADNCNSPLRVRGEVVTMHPGDQ